MKKMSGRNLFFVVVGILFVIRIAMPFVMLPPGAAVAVSLLLGIVFVGVPILALFLASRDPWLPKLSATFLALGIALHGAAILVGRGAFIDALGQTGLMIWCCGLGGLLAALLRDKNLLVPLAIFLAGFDAFLILNPTSLPRQIMQKSPEVFTKVAAQVPTVVQRAPGVTGIGPGAFVGPADFIFLTMFFMVLHRFKMRSAETLAAMIPVLVAYLFVVLLFGHVSIGPVSLAQLPALVPIGLVVLIVNAREFKMQRDEKAATWVVAFISLALAVYGGYRAATSHTLSAQPTEPLIAVPVPAPEAPARTRATTSPDPRR